MKKKILIGSIIAVALLTLVSFSSVVGYNVVTNTQEEIITDKYEGFTPIALVFQLISKLRDYKDIENAETESDAEFNGIIEKLESFDCGCEDDNPELSEQFDTIIMNNEELSNRIYTLHEMNLKSEEPEFFPVICDILFSLVVYVMNDIMYGNWIPYIKNLIENGNDILASLTFLWLQFSLAIVFVPYYFLCVEMPIKI